MSVQILLFEQHSTLWTGQFLRTREFWSVNIVDMLAKMLGRFEYFVAFKTPGLCGLGLRVDVCDVHVQVAYLQSTVRARLVLKTCKQYFKSNI